MKKNSVKNIFFVNVTIKKSCEYKDFMQACLSSSETKKKNSYSEPSKCKSSRPEVFCKNCVVINRLKKDSKKLTLAQVFLVDFSKFLRTPFFMEHLWWLLLKVWSRVFSYHLKGMKEMFLVVSSVVFKRKVVVSKWSRDLIYNLLLPSINGTHST